MRFPASGDWFPGKFAHDLVNVAPSPVLAGFNRTHHGMLRLVEVPGRVAPWRGITTADVATSHALAQMDPLRPFLQTLLAPPWRSWWRKIGFR